jgi:potassium voltage-gated channel subfamily G protein 1
VRGFRYEVLLRNLNRSASSRLGKLKMLVEEGQTSPDSLLALCDDFDLSKNEFYFDRDPFIFNTILNYYSTGKLHIENNSCALLLSDEMIYWNMEEKYFYGCCQWKYFDRKDEVQGDLDQEKKLIGKLSFKVNFDSFIWPKLREKIWYIMEVPSSSIWAKVLF